MFDDKVDNFNKDKKNNSDYDKKPKYEKRDRGFKSDKKPWENDRRKSSNGGGDRRRDFGSRPDPKKQNLMLEKIVAAVETQNKLLEEILTHIKK
ncbi:hypothetical protein [Spiroplasma endosymbiont of Amphibalanus improvisus]|uniref:hypothetical protein n=1 Tax=Spiroplasma endosymbiont of Amphibalanus improvisus TaxID=3066327 RepID=UPI00313B7FFC